MNTKRHQAPLSSRISNLLQRHEDISFQYLADQIGDAFFLAGQGSGLFRSFNHKAVELTGFTQVELERLSLSELMPVESSGETLEQIHRLELGLQRSFQNVVMRVKGAKTIRVDLKVSATLGADGDPVVTILARDPAERLMLERAATQHHKALTAMTHLADLVIDAFTAPASETSKRLMEFCQQITGADSIAIYRHSPNYNDFILDDALNLPPEFPPSLTATDVAFSGLPLNWRAGERPTSVLTRAARNARYALFHGRIIVPGDTSSAILVTGYPNAPYQTLDTGALTELSATVYGMFSTLRRMRDLNDFDRARLASLTDVFESWQAESGEGTIHVNSDGFIISLNPAAETLLGFRQTDSNGHPLEDVIVSAQPIAQPILTAFRNRQVWGGIVVDLVRRDGSSIAVYLRAVPVPGERGEGLVLIADRTDQRQFQAQSDHLERRAWLGDLSAIFAHDVRNPLNGIATGLSYLAGKFEPDDVLADSVSKMQAEVNRIEQLLKNVLLVAKSSELNYQPVALHHLLERILSRWENRLARRKILLEHDIDPRTPLAMADVHQIDQVFTNLLVNAYDAMAETGGTLSVKCHAATDHRTPHGDYVQVLFSDTGPGIQAELLNKVFDPFVTTKADGTGLGLAITKRIVTAHRGSIVVESWPGIGSAFFIFIPVAKRVASA